MSIEIDKLISEAEKVLDNSYAPYSRIRVASAVLCSDGRVFTGVNVENSSYGLTVCAERTAIFNAVTNGCRDFRAIAIVTDFDEPLTPCGACRQVMIEFVSDIIIVSKSVKTGIVKEYRLSELLPHAFKLKR